MTRLTHALKNAIIDNALKKAGIPEKKASLRAARIDWAERVRIDALGGERKAAEISLEINDIAHRISKLPTRLRTGQNFYIKRDSIHLNVGGYRVQAFFNGNHEYCEGVDSVVKLTCYEHTLTAKNPLTNEFHRFDKIHSEIANQEKSIRAQVAAVLNTVNTLKKLLEIWPEAKTLLPDEQKTATPLPPAVRREDLNTLIGLP